MLHRRIFPSLFVLLTAFTGGLFGNNVFLLPTFSGTATGTARIYNATTLAQIGTTTVSSEAFLILTKPTQKPEDVRYYVISRSGTNSLQTLDANFQPVGTSVSYNQAVSAAAITPDGSKLLIMAGNLHIIDTATNVDQVASPDVGIAPSDIAISMDSKRAFFVSAGAQEVTSYNLANNTVIGHLNLPLVTSVYAGISPNGMLYITANDQFYEIDTRSTTFDSTAIRRHIQFPGSKLLKPAFTPDGKRALVANGQPQSGALLYLIDISFASNSLSTSNIASNISAFAGFSLDKVFVVNNTLAYVVNSNLASSQPRHFYEVTIPGDPAAGQPLDPPTMQEAFFASLGNIPIVDSVAISREYPRPSRMIVSAPLSLVPPNLATNTVYAMDMVPSVPNKVGETTLNFLPGPVNYAAPAVTTDTEGPGGIVPYNGTQPVLALGGKSLPFGVRLLGVSNRPLFNVPMVFTTTTSGVTIDQLTVLTNSDGFAFNTVTAPTTPGQFTVNVSVGGSGLSTSFNFVVGNNTGGGGGGGGGGTEQLIVYSGNGQVLQEGSRTSDDSHQNPMKVRLIDGAGKPIAGATITWNLTSGNGLLYIFHGQVADTMITTTTDAEGFATADYQPGILGIGTSSNLATITASSGTSTVTLYVTTTLLVTTGGLAPAFSYELLTPATDPRSIRGKAGQTLNGAIRVQSTIAAGPVRGAAMPFVGLSATTGADPKNAPTVTCTPDNVALSNDQGIAICDLKLAGKAGTGFITLDIGGQFSPTIRLTVDPGDPTNLTLITGNGQSGKAGDVLGGPLVVQLDDGGGNVLSGYSIRWEVLSGSATLIGGNTTTTGTNGQSTNTIRLGNTPGQVQIKATALGGTQPSVIFNLTVSVTVAGLAKVSGDPQTTFTNTSFTNPLIAKVSDTQGNGVPNQTVTFTVTSGTATVTGTSGVAGSTATATTDSTGSARVTVRAGANPGPITITASAAGTSTVLTYNLTAQLPGPVINALDFFNAASNERGAVVPGSIYTLVGSGIAPDLKGCIVANTVLGPAPTRLNTVEVQFGSILAPILSVCNVGGREQVSFQVPFELAFSGQVAVTVRVGSGSSVVNGVQIKDLQPGIFETVDSQNRRYAVAIHASNGTPVTPDSPAHYGETIRFFITGFGQLSPVGITNAAGVPGQIPVAPIATGLNDAGVPFSSVKASPTIPGVVEVELQIPSGTTTGTSRSLGIIMLRNGQPVYPTNNPTIAIAP